LDEPLRVLVVGHASRVHTFAGNPSLYLACIVCGEPRHHHHHHVDDDVSNNNNNNNTSTSSENNSNKQNSASGIKNNRSRTARSRKIPRVVDQQKSAQAPAVAAAAASTSAASLDSKKQQREPQETSPVVVPLVDPRDDDDDDMATRRPPSHSALINKIFPIVNIVAFGTSKCFSDGYCPDVTRGMLARIARHVNPIILRGARRMIMARQARLFGKLFPRRCLAAVVRTMDAPMPMTRRPIFN
jgi:hypothetical protein